MPNVIVTGGSRGLGIGIAEKLATTGYDVIAVARRQSDDLAERVRQTEKGGPGSLAFKPFDLGDIAGLPDFVRDPRKEFGPYTGW
jgi:3-oxoacyl-[acyl-carrier protein] reductase